MKVWCLACAVDGEPADMIAVAREGELAHDFYCDLHKPKEVVCCSCSQTMPLDFREVEWARREIGDVFRHKKCATRETKKATIDDR